MKQLDLRKLLKSWQTFVYAAFIFHGLSFLLLFMNWTIADKKRYTLFSLSGLLEFFGFEGELPSAISGGVIAIVLIFAVLIALFAVKMFQHFKAESKSMYKFGYIISGLFILLCILLYIVTEVIIALNADSARELAMIRHTFSLTVTPSFIMIFAHSAIGALIYSSILFKRSVNNK